MLHGDAIFNVIDQNIYIFIFAIIIWLAVVSYYLYKTVAHYNKLIQYTDKKSLTEVLDKIFIKLSDNKKHIDGLKDELSKLKLENVVHIQKVGLLRFNPFKDTGGDQSFVLAILDSENTGVVLTSLHNRGITRWYAKKVKQGKGIDHQLSEEEKKAIALGS